MVDFDRRNDTTPQQKWDAPSKPTIADLKAALATVNGGASYTAARLNTMTLNDCIYAARLEGLSVTGL